MKYPGAFVSSSNQISKKATTFSRGSVPFSVKKQNFKQQIIYLPFCFTMFIIWEKM
nr:MAG TPA: hypothetical protein [Bacteriophage sp.]